MVTRFLLKHQCFGDSMVELCSPLYLCVLYIIGIWCSKTSQWTKKMNILKI